MGLLLMPVAAGLSYALSLGAVAGVLAVAGCSVAGLLASGHRRRWVRGEAAVVAVFRGPGVSQWACLGALLSAVLIPAAMPQALRLYYAAMLPLAVLLLVAGVVVLLVLRALVEVEVLRVYPRHVSMGLLGPRTRIESVRVVPDRELSVTFENGRTFSFWLPRRVAGSRDEAIEQMRSVEAVVSAVIVSQRTDRVVAADRA